MKKDDYIKQIVEGVCEAKKIVAMPSPAEQEILIFLANNGKSTAKQIFKGLRRCNSIMDRMLEKKLIKHDDSRPRLYEPNC